MRIPCRGSSPFITEGKHPTRQLDPLGLVISTINLPSLAAARAHYPEVTAPIHLIYGEKDWSRPSDRQANRRLLPDAEFTQIPNVGHFIALERPDVPAGLLNAVA